MFTRNTCLLSELREAVRMSNDLVVGIGIANLCSERYDKESHCIKVHRIDKVGVVR